MPGERADVDTGSFAFGRSAGDASMQCSCVNIRVVWAPPSPGPYFHTPVTIVGCRSCPQVSGSLAPPLHVSERAFGDQPPDLALSSVLRSFFELREICCFL